MNDSYYFPTFYLAHFLTKNIGYKCFKLMQTTEGGIIINMKHQDPNIVGVCWFGVTFLGIVYDN